MSSEVARPNTSVSAASSYSVEKVSNSSPASVQKSNSPSGPSWKPSTVDMMNEVSVPSLRRLVEMRGEVVEHCDPAIDHFVEELLLPIRSASVSTRDDADHTTAAGR